MYLWTSPIWVSSPQHQAVQAAAAVPLYSCFPFVTGRHAQEQDQKFADTIRSLKQGDRAAAKLCAGILADHPSISSFTGILTPAPRSTSASPRSNILLCEALLAEGIGQEAIAFVGRAEDMPSAAKLRERGRGEIKTERHVQSMHILEEPPPDEKILIIDDVFTTGSTLRAVATVLVQAGVPNRNLSAATVAYRSYQSGTGYTENQYVTLQL